MIKHASNQQSAISNQQWISLAAILVATQLRLLPLLENRFHPDEALYASFARLIVSGRDPLLSSVVVDKPPLSFYLTALSFLLLGSTEFAARLPNFYASLLSLALLFALARRLYDPSTAQLATWILALSPFSILFSITVFIDPLLTLFVLWGLWAVLTRQSRAAGVTFALAFATKQTTLLFLPLAFALMLLTLPPSATPHLTLRWLASALRPILISLSVAALVIFSWDAIRHAPIGFWQQGYADNVPGRFARANEVWPRLSAWLDLLHYFTASQLLNALFILGLPLLIIADLRHTSRLALADLSLTAYLLLYLAGYWLLAFNIWDRYLLPILPLLALLLARIAVGGWRLVANSWSLAVGRLPLSTFHLPFLHSSFFLRPSSFVLRPLSSVLRPPSSVLFLLLLLPSALTASHSGYPIGGDHGPYDGIDDAARFIRTLPYGGVLYDHWLNWEWNFYLFDGPLYIAWFPAPESLTTDLLSFGHTSPRYLAVPAWESDTEVRAAAEQAGFKFIALHTSYRRDGSASIIVYQLVPKP
jgi:4-amino-4-deoxy-L-arabinose transferase-like glycosyltransferase